MMLYIMGTHLQTAYTHEIKATTCNPALSLPDQNTIAKMMWRSWEIHVICWLFWYFISIIT